MWICSCNFSRTICRHKILSVGPKQRDRITPLESDGFSVQTLDHQSFLRELSSADVFLTTPGLTATFESFALGIPCRFLPPFNYSQFLNLLAFRNAGVAPYSIHWCDYGIGGGISVGMEETSAVRRIEKLIVQAMADHDLVRKMRSDMATLIGDALQAVGTNTLRTHQKKYFTDLGGIGTTTAAAFTLETLNG